jgi:thiamine pyrophosphate-dependent acetolactate synthase large subunit-like protein
VTAETTETTETAAIADAAGAAASAGVTAPSVAVTILQMLASAGVTTVFGLPGVHNLAFWQEGEGLPEIIGTRHEQTTVYAADGLARATGGLGVALTTTGPGVANAAGAFGEAAACGSPVLLISSEVSTKTARPGVMRGGLHESRDQAAIFRPLAKAVFTPRTAHDAVSQVAEAAALALQSPQGPVYVDIPFDILESPGTAVASIAQTRRLPVSQHELLDAVALIERSQEIVIWAGGGVVQSGAETELVALAELLQAPIVTTWAGRGIVPAGHPLSVDLPPHEPEVAGLIASADLLIVVGSELDGPNTKNWTLTMPASVLVINVDAGEVGKNYPATTTVIADARVALDGIARSLGPRRESAQPLDGLRARAIDRDTRDPRTASAVEFVAAIESAVSARDAIVINDMAVGGYWFGSYGRFGSSRRMQYPIGWGTLGYALPAAIGPGALGDSPVLAICGDGGAMFGIGELAVLVENQMPVTVLLIDDGGYGMLRFDQIVNGHAQRGVDLARPDFAQLAESFGVSCATTDVAGLKDALDEALGAGRPRMVLLNHALYPPLTVSARWFE